MNDVTGDMICPFWGHWVCELHVTIISLWSTFCVLSIMRICKKMTGPDRTFELSRELVIIKCLLCASYFTEHFKNVKSILSITLWQEFKIPILPVEKTEARESSITCLGSLSRWQSRDSTPSWLQSLFSFHNIKLPCRGDRTRLSEKKASTHFSGYLSGFISPLWLPGQEDHIACQHCWVDTPRCLWPWAGTEMLPVSQISSSRQLHLQGSEPLQALGCIWQFGESSGMPLQKPSYPSGSNLYVIIKWFS